MMLIAIKNKELKNKKCIFAVETESVTISQLLISCLNIHLTYGVL